MNGENHVTFYLPDGLRKSAEAGEHNFIGKVESVVRNAGLDVVFRDPSKARRDDPGYSLLHMQDPLNDRGVTIRRAYFYPFWQIERTNARWHWDVAKADFHSGHVNRNEAEGFYRFWQKRLFKDHLDKISNQGFVYVPLQGKLLERRSFQECSPIRMLHHILEQVPDQPIIAALHPNEHYDPDEIAALEVLETQHDRLEIRIGEMETLLAGCDFVVTQNSSAAFAGLFFGKPSVLFGRIDFHHIAANAAELGVERAFRQVQDMTPDYAGYVWWFLQQMSINAGRPEAEEKIRDRLRVLGWPV